MTHASYKLTIAHPHAIGEVPMLLWALAAATVLAAVSLMLSSVDPAVQPFMSYITT